MADSQSADWRRYPFELIPGDSEFTFPAAEAVHQLCQSDTWFIAGELTGTKSKRRFCFLTIFNKNRPGGSIVADFYTLALFDIDNGAYGTYTDYDMPPKNMAPGAVPKLSASTEQLDIAFASRAGTAAWQTRRDERGQLVPYTYDLALVGTDRSGAAMDLRLSVSPTRAPVPVGASKYNGRFECLGQRETFSYFQTGMLMVGTLSWGDIHEEVRGSAGHIDRQWFPLYAGGGGTDGQQRAISHEWRTIHLDNGVDFVGWRQFDRNQRNTLRPFTGATVTYSEPGISPECVEDVEVDTTSYVRWPEAVRQLVSPPVEVRYMPDRHRLRSAALELDLAGEPLVAAPAHALPVEYMEGPFRFVGTMRGQPVSGFGISERSFALYRDWELIDVLAAATGNLEPQPDDLVSSIDALRPIVTTGQSREAADYLEDTVLPLVNELPVGQREDVHQVAEALIAALSHEPTA
ncbi:secreted hydrolase [Mycolicibacter heraklionensis]|uniref:Secreted hydrolase n=1 Tax=Mycolicibacter heraklionensis TaxID=512402 RepID=A0ABR5FFH4_9MYCO|nr:secreted hydrolase [Mycolicibacter heraklionensis]